MSLAVDAVRLIHEIEWQGLLVQQVSLAPKRCWIQCLNVPQDSQTDSNKWDQPVVAQISTVRLGIAHKADGWSQNEA